MQSKERIAWSLSLIVLAVTAFYLPRSLANRDDDYTFVRTLVDIHRKVAADYVDKVDEQKLQQSAIDGMLGQLDPFTAYVPPAKREEFDRMLEGTFKGVGIQLNQLDNGKIEVVTPIEGSPAHRAGVMAGDIILKVNGDAVDGLRLPDVVKKIGGELDSQVTLTVQHTTGETADLTMKRQEIVVPTLKGFQRTEDNAWDWYVSQNPKIAYLRLTQFTPATLDRIKEVLSGDKGKGTRGLLDEGMQGLILDLRYNPGGQLDQAVQLVDLFIDKGVIVSTRGRNRREDVKRATSAGTLANFPLIVLVNEHSASASEIVAGSLADNGRALVVGTRTYGKGSVQELVPLDGNNGELKLTVAYYYLPSGRLVHRKKDAKDWGVEPHIVVAMSDEQQKAMQRERLDQESFRRPTTKGTTKPANGTAAATQPVDVQLQRAVDTMIAGLIFEGKGPKVTVSAPMSATATAPTTQPGE